MVQNQNTVCEKRTLFYFLPHKVNLYSLTCMRSSIAPSFCSVYKVNSVYFGGYPSEAWFQELIDFGITVFIDLTTPLERKGLPFNYDFPSTIFYPIRDNHIPSQTESFRRLVIKIADMVRSGREKIYIHCKGGHGRSGLLIASLMCYLDELNPYEALDRTTFIHSIRKEMKNKYRDRRCPDNYQQQRFVIDIFRSTLRIDHKCSKALLQEDGLQLAVDPACKAEGQKKILVYNKYG